MAYIPGFSSDVFLSYAHADDRGWVEALAARLTESLRRLFGPDLSIWLDGHDLRKSRDFNKEIPAEVKTSAAFLLLASPNYTRSDYCINIEYEEFRKTIESKRVRFNADKFRNQLFAVRARILPVEGNTHWKLFDGLTDVGFHHEGSETFKAGSSHFDGAFRTLTDELAALLRDMRNRVF